MDFGDLVASAERPTLVGYEASQGMPWVVVQGTHNDGDQACQAPVAVSCSVHTVHTESKPTASENASALEGHKNKSRSDPLPHHAS